MIALLTGTLAEKSPGLVIVDVSGVGYEVHVPLTTFYGLPEPGGDVRLHIHTHVREDAISLFGFADTRDKALFLLLLGISGVGPKVALGILSGLPYDSLVGAISTGDEKLVSTIPGVGKKTAARIVLELKEKLESIGVQPGATASLPSGGPGGPERMEAVSALVNLGYKKPAAEEAVDRVCRESDEPPRVEDIIRKALKSLSR